MTARHDDEKQVQKHRKTAPGTLQNEETCSSFHVFLLQVYRNCCRVIIIRDATALNADNQSDSNKFYRIVENFVILYKFAV